MALDENIESFRFVTVSHKYTRQILDSSCLTMNYFDNDPRKGSLSPNPFRQNIF